MMAAGIALAWSSDSDDQTEEDSPRRGDENEPFEMFHEDDWRMDDDDSAAVWRSSSSSSRPAPRLCHAKPRGTSASPPPPGPPRTHPRGLPSRRCALGYSVLTQACAAAACADSDDDNDMVVVVAAVVSPGSEEEEAERCWSGASISLRDGTKRRRGTAAAGRASPHRVSVCTALAGDGDDVELYSAGPPPSPTSVVRQLGGTPPTK